MSTTYFLATVLGWYLVIMGLLLLSKREELIALMKDVVGQRSLLFVVAFITFIMGLLMVVSHNIWVMGWPVVITLFSWLILISGLIRLYFPDTVYKMWAEFVDKPVGLIVSGVVIMIIGLFLLFHVYFV